MLMPDKWLRIIAEVKHFLVNSSDAAPYVLAEGGSR
jgi:hypothetical protein